MMFAHSTLTAILMMFRVTDVGRCECGSSKKLHGVKLRAKALSFVSFVSAMILLRPLSRLQSISIRLGWLSWDVLVAELLAASSA